MLYVDFCIIASSYFLFHNIVTIVYGLIILFTLSFTVDQLINSTRQSVQFTIISPKHWIEIADAINSQAHRGCTVYDGMGWYSKHEVKIIMVVCRRMESVTMFRIIKSIDPAAFITQANVTGAYGLGFDEIKLKTKPSEKAGKTDAANSHKA